MADIPDTVMMPPPSEVRPAIGGEGLTIPTSPMAPGPESAMTSAHLDLRNMQPPPKPLRMRPGEGTVDAEAVPFDVWAASLVDWSTGEFTAVVHRKRPTQIVMDNRQHYVAGRLGELHECPTESMIEELFGGGEGYCEVVGPGPNQQPKHYGSRSWRAASDPKPRSTGSAINEHARGESMGNEVVGQVVGILGKRLEKVEDRADGHAAGPSSPLLEFARQAGEASAKVDAVRAETEAKFAEDRVRQLERQLEEAKEAARARGNGTSTGEIFSGMRELIGALQPPQAARNSGVDVEYYTNLLREQRERHQREIDDLRKMYEDRITALKDDARQQLDRLRDDQRHAMERERESQRSRIDDLEARHRSEVERARDNEKAGAAAIFGTKDARIESLQHELERLREDKREVLDREREEKKELKERLTKAEDRVTDLASKLVRAEALLEAAPKEAKTFAGQIKEIAGVQKSLREFLGKDDDDDDKPGRGEVATGILGGLKEILDHPMVEALAKKGLDHALGEDEANRKKELKQQAMQVLREKEHRKDALKMEELKLKKLEAANKLGLGLPGQQQAVQAPQQGQAQGAAPAAAPGIAKYWEAGDPPLPDAPKQRPELTDRLQRVATLLTDAEGYVRAGHEAARFVDAMSQQVPLEKIRDWLLATWQTHGEFLSSLADDGAERAFPALFHPVGRRWWKDVWVIIAQRVGPPGIDAINAARAANQPSAESEDDDKPAGDDDDEDDDD